MLSGLLRTIAEIVLAALLFISVYVSAESGDVRVFRENGKALVPEGTLSMPHAHTVSVDPDTHLVYFPLQNIDGHPVLRIMEPAQSH